MAKKTTKTTTTEDVEVSEVKTTRTTSKAKVDEKKDSSAKAASKTVENKSAVKKTTAKKANVEETVDTKKEVKSSKAEKTTKVAPAKESKKMTTKEVATSEIISKNGSSDTEVVKNIEKTVKSNTVASATENKSKIKSDNNPDISTVRYSDEDLEMFAVVINDAKTEALDELRMLKERLEDLTSFDSGEESMIYSMHMAEQGSEAQEKEKTYAQIQRISEHIKKLEDAMERIRNKTYGICRVCGCLIAKERLLAVPVTTLSAAYKIHSKCPDDGIDKIEPVKF